MNKNEIMEVVKDLRELKRMKEELEAEISANEDLLKKEMERTNTDTISGDDYKVTWKEVTSSRIDTKELKKALPDVIAKFTKTITSRRFCIV